MSENWGVVSFWVKLWALTWLLVAHFVAMTMRGLFRRFQELLPRTWQ